MVLAAFPISALGQQEDPSFRKAMDAGKAAVDKGDYGEALIHFEEALARDPSSKGVVFNMGYCLLKLERYEEAISRFQAFIGMNPGEEKAEKARLYVEVAKKELAKQTPPDKDKPQPIAQPEAEVSPWPWVVAGTGGAVAIVGTTFFLVALGQISTAEDDLAANKITEDQYDTRYNDALDTAVAGRWTLIAGGAVAVAGVVWGVVDSSSSPSSSTTLFVPWTAPDTWGLSAAFSF